MSKLTGPQLAELREILLDAFELDEFDRMMQDRLDKKRQQFGLGNDYEQILYLVLGKANNYGWLPQLVRSATEVNPSHGRLYQFALDHFGLGVNETPTGSQLERIVDSSNGFLDIVKFLSRLGTTYRQVCRISFGNGADPQGSGFLIGPSSVMTNYHVMEKVIEEKIEPGEVRVQFDFATLPDGTVDNGRRVELAANWLTDSSPYTQMDVDGTGAVPTIDQLDYAIIRLAEPVGKQPVGSAETLSPKRSWIDITKHDVVPEVNAPIYIVQHPRGNPMKFAMASQSVIGLNENGTRLRHKTNTEGGSSGSPTFNGKFELVALHNGGDPVSKTAKFNQGVPMKLIVDLLTQRNKLAALAN
ncbi:MAG: trypsin-like peptidase domain-containing protein [Acidobacteriota bacterium]